MIYSGTKTKQKCVCVCVYRYDRRLEEAQSWGVRKGSIMGLFQGYLWCIVFLCYALAFWYGSKLVIETKELSPGTLIQVNMLALKITLSK